MSLEGALNVALFCGGRGSATISRELVRWPHVELSLLVNAYDDGLSTGALRDFIPRMLGPSDFRKNLSTLLDLHSPAQYALQRLLEHRLPLAVSATDVDALRQFARDADHYHAVGPPVSDWLRALDARTRTMLSAYGRQFFDFNDAQGEEFSFADCSLGNLFFAGAYLGARSDFNASLQRLASLFGADARLINVSQGENRTLVALKADGEILYREAAIVGPQSAVAIVAVFLLERPLTAAEQQALAALGATEKAERLRELERTVTISPEADEALRNADIIVYGPGTQFSSLLPSYRTRGVPEAIAESRARLRIFVCNLDADHDIQGLSGTELVDRALTMLDDPDNAARSITHILYGGRGIPPTPLGEVPRQYKGARFIQDTLAHPLRPQIHSGYAVVKRALSLLDSEGDHERPTLDIYVDLLARSLAVGALLQEFTELPWSESFSHVRLRLNRVDVPEIALPPHLSVERTDYVGLFSEVVVMQEWLSRPGSDYLLALTGDGEYRLRDVFVCTDVFRAGAFGAVHGSRTQSRRQFRSSLRAAYGESVALYGLSWLGAYIFTAVFGLRFRVVLSDPLTGFRLYRRSRIGRQARSRLLRQRLPAAGTVTKILLGSRVEIAEVPVTYRTFKGFTRSSWRLWRGLKNLLGIFR